MSLWIIFSNSITCTMINKYGKVGVVQTWTVLGLLTMLLVERSSERGILRHLFNNLFLSAKFRKYISCERSLFLKKCTKFNLALKKSETSWGNVICFLDNCIWIGRLGLSLLSRKYLSSAVNMLTDILKTFHITKKIFFKLNRFHNDQ